MDDLKITYLQFRKSLMRRCDVRWNPICGGIQATYKKLIALGLTEGDDKV